MEYIWLIPLLPGIGAAVNGLVGIRYFSRATAGAVACGTMVLALGFSLVAFFQLLGLPAAEREFDVTVAEWLSAIPLQLSDGSVGSFAIPWGFRLDPLSGMMLLVVTGIGTLIHVYSTAYMHDEPRGGFVRFFCYLNLFCFFMLMLVLGNNFLVMFVGWEGVGLCSYLLIGFWYQRESAIYANLKAFLVNRVGDFGFVLGIAAILAYFNTVDYQDAFAAASLMKDVAIEIIPGHPWSLLTVICILLFIGAMGKSAQVPLHVWLPDSMEGPTPISALIHAATMVTAGIFMVARMSPLYELSETALSVVLVIGAITAFFMGLLGIVQNDIKRVVAYSTLSQLGYMVVALGASAYAAGIFHLMTHAFFKALLFLAAGSVIIAMHHEQDIRRMGGLRKYMPITYWTALIGSLALIGFPGTSGFFSKDAIIEAVHESHLPGAGFAYAAVLLGVFVTALYSFRMFFLVFHGKERMDHHTREHLHESPWVVTVPLILLAVPSLAIGAFTVGPLLFGDWFGKAIEVLPAHDTLAHLGEEFTGAGGFLLHGLLGLPFWFAMAGLATAWFIYMRRPDIADTIQRNLAPLNRLLERNYYADQFNDFFFAGGGRRLGRLFWRAGDVAVIDGAMVNGTAHGIGWIATRIRRVQSGFLYHYAFAMILGLLLLLFVFVIV
jgi:NADH-quinone oxidoreductase subunit L